MPDIEIETIYQLTAHNVDRHRMAHRYPTYRLSPGASAFFNTVEEVELFLRQYSYHSAAFDTYCYSLSELPKSLLYYVNQSLSERIYLQDGQFWSVRRYADIYPVMIPHQYSEVEFDNYLYGRCVFDGREQKEVRFKRGDIVEIFCYSATEYWGGSRDSSRVELAIVVDTPPSKEMMTVLKERYLQNEAKHLTGDIGFDLGIWFDAKYDVYAVIPAYLPANAEIENLIDYCPTFCAMQPHYEVSQRMRKKLQTMLERLLESDTDTSIYNKLR